MSALCSAFTMSRNSVTWVPSSGDTQKARCGAKKLTVL